MWLSLSCKNKYWLDYTQFTQSERLIESQWCAFTQLNISSFVSSSFSLYFTPLISILLSLPRLYTSKLSLLWPFFPSSPLSLFRCNVQDYIWHKGARCESVVTEFQVMCLAVGASALVVLLLFMIIVCFAKKLHVLKTENKKLRKRRWGWVWARW